MLISSPATAKGAQTRFRDLAEMVGLSVRGGDDNASISGEEVDALRPQSEP